MEVPAVTSFLLIAGVVLQPATDRAKRDKLVRSIPHVDLKLDHRSLLS